MYKYILEYYAKKCKKNAQPKEKFGNALFLKE